MRNVLVLLLCGVTLFTMGCTPTDDATATTTTREITTTAMISSADTTDKTNTTKGNGKVTTSTNIPQKPTTTNTTKPIQTDPKAITCYGDSVTEGMGVGTVGLTVSVKGLPYPGVLQELLGSDYQGQKINLW